MVTVKNSKEIEIMKEGGRRLALVMEQLEKMAKPGVDTESLDREALALMKKMDSRPAFLNYGKESGNPFPASICASLNDEIVHGIPNKKRIVKSGDLLKLDIGLVYRGFFLDMARTVAIGKVSNEARQLMEVTENCFWEGIRNLRAGSWLSEYSKASEKCAKKAGFSVVENLVGHGVGRNLHEDPVIPNFFYRRFEDMRLKAGMTLAFEPMINIGTHLNVLGQDGWVFKTKDGSLSAHYENTVLITDKGTEVLTLLSK